MEAFAMAMAGPPHDAFFRRIRDMRTEAHKRADDEILGRLTNETEPKTLTEAEAQLDLMQVRTERVRRMMARLQAEMRAKYDEARNRLVKAEAQLPTAKAGLQQAIEAAALNAGLQEQAYMQSEMHARDVALQADALKNQNMSWETLNSNLRSERLRLAKMRSDIKAINQQVEEAKLNNDTEAAEVFNNRGRTLVEAAYRLKSRIEAQEANDLPTLREAMAKSRAELRAASIAAKASRAHLLSLVDQSPLLDAKIKSQDTVLHFATRDVETCRVALDQVPLPPNMSITPAEVLLHSPANNPTPPAVMPPPPPPPAVTPPAEALLHSPAVMSPPLTPPQAYRPPPPPPPTGRPPPPPPPPPVGRPPPPPAGRPPTKDHRAELFEAIRQRRISESQEANATAVNRMEPKKAPEATSDTHKALEESLKRIRAANGNLDQADDSRQDADPSEWA